MPATTTRPRHGKMIAIKTGGGITRWVPEQQSTIVAPSARPTMPTALLRNEMGVTLRQLRLDARRTLRDVSTSARVSLGYLSEVERGKKEISSEILSSICEALQIPLAHVLRAAAARIELAEGVDIPDTVPEEFTLEPVPA